MKDFYLIFVFILGLNSTAYGQISNKTFGDGLKVIANNIRFYLIFGARFQNLASGEWRFFQNGSDTEFSSNFVVRRSRLKFDGYVFSPKRASS